MASTSDELHIVTHKNTGKWFVSPTPSLCGCDPNEWEFHSYLHMSEIEYGQTLPRRTLRIPKVSFYILGRGTENTFIRSVHYQKFLDGLHCEFEYTRNRHQALKVPDFIIESWRKKLLIDMDHRPYHVARLDRHPQLA